MLEAAYQSMRAKRRHARIAGAALAVCVGCASPSDSVDQGHGGGGQAPSGNGSGASPAATGGSVAPGAGGSFVAASGGRGGAGGAGAGGQAGTGGAPGAPPGTGGSGGDAGMMPVTDAGMSGTDSGGPQVTTYPPLEGTQIGTPAMVANTFSLAEGPVWDHCHDVLLFTDVNANAINRLTPPSTIDVFRMDTNYANGIAFDPQGRLVMAQMGPDAASGRVARINAAGMEEVVVDKGPMGVSLNTSDDLVILSDGTIYFTDPVFAHGPCTLTCIGVGQLPVYRVSPDGMITLEAMTSGPNGIDISPDEKTLYVNSLSGGQTLRFDIGVDRKLTPAQPLAGGLSSPDSMCVDAGGNVYVCVSTGISVFHPDGTPVTTIPIGSAVTNCGFGGPDGKTLYISAWSTLWKVENMPIPGLDWVMNKDMPCN